jgi:hypothetical protein
MLPVYVWVILSSYNPEDCLYPPIITWILGVSLTLFTLLGLFAAIKHYINPEPDLIANKNGIFLCKSDILIPWDSVKDIYIKDTDEIFAANIDGSSFLYIDVKNYDELIEHIPIYKRFGYISGGKSFAIGIVNYDLDAEYVRYMLVEYYYKYKTN